MIDVLIPKVIPSIPKLKNIFSRALGIEDTGDMPVALLIEEIIPRDRI